MQHTTSTVWALLASGLLASCLLPNGASGFDVELRELINPAEAYAIAFQTDADCPPDGCLGILTRDGSTDELSRFSCYQPGLDWGGEPCSVDYEISDTDDVPAIISSVHVAFLAESKTNIEVSVDGTVVTTWEGEEGSTEFQEISGLAGYSGVQLTLKAANEEGDWFAITETKIYVEVEDVPVIGSSASDRVTVTATASVNDGDAAETLDGSTATSSSWSCSKEDVCSVTYDLQEVQSIEQIRVAFVENDKTEGATFDVYLGVPGDDIEPILQGAKAGARDPSIEGLQTFGDVRGLARVVTIIGIVGSGGKFSISEVDIRLKDSAAVRPTDVHPEWVEVGKLPLGADPGSNAGVPFDPRPASEGGCSAGHIAGCNVYYIKDGDNSPQSRWSCSPTVGQPYRDVCVAQFDLNTYKYLKQIKLAFHEGDERPEEFSVLVRTAAGWAAAIPSAITSGDTTDFQTFDLNVFTSGIQIIPKFSKIDQFMNIKEMVLLEKKQYRSQAPILSYSDPTPWTWDTLTGVDLPNGFRVDLYEAGQEVQVVVGTRLQLVEVTAVKIKFPATRVFSFEITYFTGDDDQVVDSFTSAGGERVWEEFVLSQAVMTSTITVVAVEGPDKTGYPVLRFVDLRVTGTPAESNSIYVVTTTIEEWDVVPDYIGNAQGDQEELQMAICEAAGLDFDGADCDGDSSGSSEPKEVRMVMGDYYLDGPVYLKSGVDLRGVWSEDDSPYETRFYLHGDPTSGPDGIINADGVTGVDLESIHIIADTLETAMEGTVGNVCIDIKNSMNISMNEMAWGCPAAGVRYTDSEAMTASEIYLGAPDGNSVVLKGVSDLYLFEFYAYGLVIEDSTNVLLEGVFDDGDYVGGISPPDGGDQTANLVITGTSSDVYLKNVAIREGAEPRVLLESLNPVVMEAVAWSGAVVGECLIQVPEGAPDDIIVQVNPTEPLSRTGVCYVLDVAS